MNREAGEFCRLHSKVCPIIRSPFISHSHIEVEIDSDIAVRRKVAFLLNTLLIRSDSELPDAPSNLRTPGSSSAPVHPNSHASMISDPSSTMTSEFARKALEERGLLRALVRALNAPVPHGPDGESEGDAEFEEKVVR